MTELVSCFIGSSKEGLPYAKALRALLQDEHEVNCEVWTEAFALGQTTVEGLEKALARHSFAVLIATADDLGTTRGKTKLSPRDNVVLEFGLFVGRLGRDRAFLLVQDKDIKLPSDLLGVTLGFFSGRSTPPAQRNTMRESAGKVATQIGRLGPRESPSDPAMTEELMMSASRLVGSLRSERKARLPANQRAAWTRTVLAAALEPFLARSEDAYAAWLTPNDQKVLHVADAVNLSAVDWAKHQWGEGEGLVGRAWQNRRALAVDKRTPHEWFVARPGCENESYICVPLGGAGAPEGMLTIGSESGFDVRSGDLALLAVYAALLAFAAPVANA